MDYATQSTRVEAPDLLSPQETQRSRPTHDAPAPNLARRADADTGSHQGGNNTCFAKCKQPFNVSSFNARTLRHPHCIGELNEAAEKYNIDIVCIQEHRMLHDIEIDYKQTSEDYTLVTSSATKNSVQAAVGGVGFLMHKRARSCLTSVNSTNPRILTATFMGNPATTIVSCYSPTNCSEEEDIAAFYDNLADTLRSTPAHNLLLVCGDFNAQIGIEDCKYTYHGETNRNGSHLIGIMETFDLIATNTKFQKTPGKLWTFQYPNGSRAQLDYILARKKWLNSIMNVEAYNTFSTIGSDHRVVTAKIKLSLRSAKARKRASRTVNYKALSTDTTLQAQFAIEVSNRFEPLIAMGSLSPQAKYDALQDTCLEVGKSLLPKKPKMSWNHISSAESVNTARAELQTALDRNHTGHIASAKERLKEAYTSEEKNLLDNKIQRIQHASHENRHSMAWKVIDEITGRKTSQASMITGTPEERQNKWYQHFSSLLGNAPSIPKKEFPIEPIHKGILPINTEQFTISEINKALKQTKGGKSVGLDGIPLELWKSEEFKTHLLGYCNHALLNNVKPSQWSTSGIIPIAKKGDLSKPTNYRGISLMSIAAKLYNRLLLNRIRPHVDPLLRWNQNGFRQGRSTTSQILALRRIIEGVKAKQLPLVVVFIDFSKAFDSIHRDRMFEILHAYGIPHSIVEAIRIIYDDSSAIVLSPDGETNQFPIQAGVLQGDTLAPFLFITVLDYVLRYALRNISSDTGILLETAKSRRYPELRMHDLDFADDIALLASSINAAETLLQNVEEASNCVGLHLNAGKTKTLLLNTADTSCVNSLQGTPLENVKEFKYLGSLTPDPLKDFRLRKAQAWTACNRLEKIWKSALDRDTKLSLFRACVESILLYGSETWTVTRIFEARIDGCYTQLLRRVLNVSWRDHMTNTELYGDLVPLSTVLRRRRLQFAGHCTRALDQPVSKLVFWCPPNGRPKRGRRALTYPELLAKDVGINPAELPTLIRDRKLWREHTQVAAPIPSKDDR